MRALLSTIGSRGDVQPLVALAMALRALGHDAHLCVPPDFREWIDGLGLAVTPIGAAVKTAATRPAQQAPPSPAQQRQMMHDWIAAQFDGLAAAARGCDVVVAATALQVAARSVAEASGIPYVFAAYSPTVLPSPHHAPAPLSAPGHPASPEGDNRDLWAADAARFNETFGAGLNAHRAHLGLPPVVDVRSHMFTDRPWLAADSSLAPWPDPADAAILQTGAWIPDDERPLPAEVQTFLESGEPPVYFGFGSTRAPHDVGQMMAHAAATAGRRAIVSRGWAELSPADDQANVLAIDDVNLGALFQRVAAVVHHGGAGTTTLAALAGVPQVVVPQIYDQHYFARRVQELGIGTAHASGPPTGDSLAAALARALAPDVASRARSAASNVQRDGAMRAARHLIAGRHP